ncbi:MAG: hypothetical protein ACOCT0_00695 [Halobacteriota archaeon]
MKESWVNLYCTECDDEWTAEVSELPEPGSSYTCDCGRTDPIEEYLATNKDYEIYEELRG